MSNFSFLQAEFPAVFEAARQAETHARSDTRAACFYARRALELAVAWLCRHDAWIGEQAQRGAGDVPSRHRRPRRCRPSHHLMR